MGRQRAPLWPHEYQVDKVVELHKTAFTSFMMQPLDRYDFIERNEVEPHQGTGLDHCLLLLSDDRTDGVLVQCAGDGRAMYAAYVAGSRDIVRSRLERAVDLIIQRCTANTGAGSWQVHFNNRPARGNCRVPFEELEEQLGLVIREGNGLDAMLLDALRRRPEVSAVELSDGCVSAAYDLGLRHDKAAPEETTSPSFSPERAAELFENAVSAALELYQGEDCYSMLHGSFGLTLQEIRAHSYMSDQEIAQTCGVPEELLDCDMTVRDVLRLEGVSKSAALAHKDSTVLVPLKDLEKLTVSGQEDFAALLDARVNDVRVDEGIPELLLEGVEASELDRLHDELEAHKQAEEAMGPVM